MKDLLGFLGGALLLLLVAVLLVPFGLLLFLLLAGADLLGTLWSWVTPAPRNADPAQDARRERDIGAASIMILNWNGIDFLRDLMPSLRTAVQQHGGDHEILVIDNGSNDGSVEFLQREFPEARLVQHSHNKGFVRGYNDAFQAASKDIVILLNNDMVVDPNFLGPLLEPFAEDHVFAVSSQIFFDEEDKRREETGLTGAVRTVSGLKFRHEEIPEHAPELLPTLWAGGGSSAVDRRRLLQLGGFETLYDPFYFEDTGLSWEAWRRGWSVLVASNSRVVHAHRGTSGSLPRFYVDRINHRNNYLFHWRHLTDLQHTAASTLLLPFTVLRVALASRGSVLLHRAWLEVLAVLGTLPRLPGLLVRRQGSRRRSTRSDDEILGLAQSHHRWRRAVPKPKPHPEREPEPKPDPKPDPEHESKQEPLPQAHGERLNLLVLMARVPKLGVDGSWVQYHLLRELNRHHRVTVYALLEHADQQHFAEAFRPQVHRLVTEVLDQEPGIADLHHSVPEQLRRDYSSPRLREFAARALRCEDFDVVQVDYLEMAHVVRDLVDGVCTVHVCHDPRFLHLERQIRKGLMPKLRRFWEHAQAVNYEAWLYPRFRHVVCFSQEDQDHLRTWCRDLPTSIIPLGVDTERIRALPPSSGRRILFVGYFLHGPNVEGALWFVRRVLPLVRKEIPDACVDLVGRAPPPEIESLIGEPGVRVRGYVEDLGEAMAECALSVAPLREGGGLRSKVLEAFAYGRTMVVTPVAAAGIEAVDGEHFRVAGNEQGFADAVVRLLKDQEARHQMERAARALVEMRYTTAALAGRFEQVYREMLS